MAVQAEVTVTYVKPSGITAIYAGTFYGEDESDCIRMARAFVVKYLRPASITSANLTPTPII